jgi:hypothetical protein
MAPPDSMTLNDVKVFWNYESATDQLFVVSYSIIYNDGNPTQNVTDYFILQIWDGAVLKAQVPVNFYGYRPASVYLLGNSRLTWGGTYQVVLAGRASRWNTPPVSSSYVLSSGDWIGVDLEQLDTWCLNLADAMGSADSASYTTFIQAYGEVLNADGGKIFSKAIPGLETVRPDLFINGVSALDIPSASAELSHTYEETLTTANMGATASEALDDLGYQLGVSGKIVGGLLFFGIFILCLGGVAAVAGNSSVGILACLPLLFLGAYLGIVSLALIGIAGMICIIWMGVTFWLART